MQEPEFEVTEEIRLRAKQTVEAFRQLANSREFLKDDFAGARRVLAGSNDEDKRSMLLLLEPFSEIQGAKERGDRVVFRGRFIVIDGKKKTRATVPNAVTEAEPTQESDGTRALHDNAIDEES